jgi:hypothetical protein
MNGASALIQPCAFMVYRRAILPFFYFAYLTASDMKSFRHGKFSSQGLIKRAEITCSEKVQEFENRNFSGNRVTTYKQYGKLFEM